MSHWREGIIFALVSLSQGYASNNLVSAQALDFDWSFELGLVPSSVEWKHPMFFECLLEIPDAVLGLLHVLIILIYKASNIVPSNV